MKSKKTRKRRAKTTPANSDADSLTSHSTKPQRTTGTSRTSVGRSSGAKRKDPEPSDDGEESVPEKKRPKKSKGRGFGTDDEDEEAPSKIVTVYIEIEGPAATASSSRKVVVPKPIQRGPFFYDAYDSNFNNFKKLLAKHTPCNVKLLILSKLAWKFDVPRNLSQKTLANSDAYKAMCSALIAKKGDIIIHVYMPPPEKDDVHSYATSRVLTLICFVDLELGNRRYPPSVRSI